MAQSGAAEPVALPVPQWQRWPVLLSAGIVYVLLVVFIAARFGGWFSVVGIGGLLLGAACLGVDASRRERDALRRHLGSRSLIPVETQARDFLRGRGLGDDVSAQVILVARWREVGRLLDIDPRLLRVSDDLLLDFQPARSQPRCFGVSRLEALNDEVQAAVERGASSPKHDPAAPCRACGYDLRGLPPESRCPECGRAQVNFRTLGDYLLFVAGLVPGAAPDAAEKRPADRPSA
jgi:hypothetical protein